MVSQLKVKNFPFEDETIRKISLVNPVHDFKQMLTNKLEDQFEDAADQMQAIVIRLIDDSYQGNTYEKSIECI